MITRLPMPADVRIEEQRLTLTNRGMAVLQTPIESNFALEFEWMWVKGEGTYCDDLTVCIRSQCELSSAWPHEANDGVLVRFNPETGTISIRELRSNRVLGSTMGLKMPRGVWHQIGITDHMQNEVAVYFNEPTRPVLTVTVDSPTDGRRIGFYNREPVGRIRKVSYIDNVSIWVHATEDEK